MAMKSDTKLQPLQPQLHRLLVLTALGMVLSTGCAKDSKKWKFASWDVRKAVGWKKEDEKPEPETPTRLVATWTEAVLNEGGQKSKRGFGGRIAFFKRDSKDAIRVDGQLVVYAFDETSRPSHETHPTRKYIFPAEEFVRHEGDSAMGPSYSFWLPWDEVGGPQRNISLIARFEPKEGSIVIGEQTKHFLPGLSLDASTPQLAEREQSAVVNSVRLAAYSKQAAEAIPELAPPAAQTLTPADAAGRPKMTTETIALPPRLGASLQQAPKPGNSVTTFDPVTTGNVPLSQLSAMRQSQAAAAPTAESAAAPAQAAASPLTQPAVAPMNEAKLPLRSIAAQRAAGSESLRDSLRETLPAQARQSAPRGPVRAR
jgi:hypothetical protein